MATLEKTSSSSYIPPDIAEIIVSKLSSVKSLLRFKTVSKSWNTMISDPLFVQNHLLSSNPPNNNLFLRMHRNSGPDGGNFSLIKYEDRKIHVVKEVLEKPFSSDDVLCECNGVLLMTDPLQKYEEYVLWNPSTQQKMYIKCPYEFDKTYLKYGEFEYYVNHGICYDPITNDFKVVMISEKKYAIYSCKNNSWKRKRSRTRYEGVCSGIFVDGATFWILEDYKGRQIEYFDPRTNEVKKLHKPKKLNGDGNLICITSSRGRLCLFCTTINGYEYKVQMWIKDKGVYGNYCWNEFITIENMRSRDDTWMFSGPVCWGNKIGVWLYEKGFVYFCPSENTFRGFGEIDMDGCKNVPYQNSLYFPRGKASPSRFI